MKGPFQFFLKFNKGQRKGILALFLLIITIQAGYLVYSSSTIISKRKQSAEEKEWLSLQTEIDALKARYNVKKTVIYPFNPNFITDYKGYTLGMSVAEIGRLHKFRETGKYVNSAQEFQLVTKVSDSLLQTISPYFKFPDWVVNKKRNGISQKEKPGYYTKQSNKAKEKALPVLDINQATEEDLDKVFGIGPYFAKMILRRRSQLGAYVSMEQMDDFEKLSPEAVAGLKKTFKVGDAPQVTKLNINSASLNQLAYFPYFNKSLAKAIITQRSMYGKIPNIEELLKINDFPVEKVKIIALYLEF
ncbi:helix-hairpin-helix domain-containing protein [Flavobacterium sp. MK4S-17]|uniref:ComEA family DNA-binding protein n=1 Tax=Flavobacterium sp. MK4S-17 TaxID=2543737 RepID=UPI00135A24B1|nr:helix-hairpin-helix domain-containing protein [Flavobacterium sp. MK4S-17]